MSNLFQIGASLDACNGLRPIVKVIRKGVFPLFQIGIPILLIVLGTISAYIFEVLVMNVSQRAIKTTYSV